MACKAQSPVYTLGSNSVPIKVPNNAYIKDTNNILNKFTGIWMYQENGKIFTLNLQKSENKKLITYYVDELNGFYKYMNNGSIIVDTSDQPLSKSKITGARISVENPNKIILFFYDPERPRVSSQVDLTYSNQGGVEKLNWELRVTGILPQGVPGKTLNPATDVRVPTNMELIKQ